MAEEKEALHQFRRQLSTDSEDFPDEKLDPRIQIELEKLNKATEEINKLELELDDARAGFRQALSDSTQKLNVLAKKLGACVEKARPYYDARIKARDDLLETQKAALRYERACSMHEAAKEMVQLAEQGYMRREQPSDPAWQEMLNHATMKVNEAEKERNESEHEHMHMATNFKNSEERVQQLQRELKRAIAKSKPYFEMKIKFNQVMEEHKFTVGRLQEDVSSSKALYSQALHSLEAISDEIHRQRLERRKSQQLGVRSAGVGAEDPLPPSSWDTKNSQHIDGSVTPHSSSCSNVSLTTATVTSSDAATTQGQNTLDQSKLDDPECGISKDALHLPSVIHASADKSRNESYRQAIESSHVMSPSTDSMCSADYDENFDSPSLDEEYMNLPHTHSPRGRIVIRGSPGDSRGKTSHDATEDVFVVEPTRDEAKRGHDNTTELRGATAADHMDAAVSPSRPIPISKCTVLQSCQSHPLAKTYNADLNTPDGGNSPLGGSPSTSRKSPKLQGLILRIDPTMDPLQRVYSSRPNSLSSTPPQYYAPSHDKPVANQGPSSTSDRAAVSVAGKLPRELSAPERGLRVASCSDMASCHDDSSDTESIASTGPMIDDDQIEFLAMSFANQTTKDDNHPVFKRQAWNRMSLPPRLSYLEGYVKKPAVPGEDLIPEQPEPVPGSVPEQSEPKIDS